jgi:hypothetical protein
MEMVIKNAADKQSVDDFAGYQEFISRRLRGSSILLVSAEKAQKRFISFKGLLFFSS